MLSTAKMLASHYAKIPKRTGVYIFSDAKGIPLYVGKAVNIRNRIRSDYRETSNPAKAMLLKQARGISWEFAGSEPEALIREAALIKKLKPRYNVLLRDDKNYLYVGFTRESFPKVFVTHKKKTKKSRIFNLESRKKPPKIPTSKFGFKILSSKFIGPFTDGSALKRVLKVLRAIFPYCVCRVPHRRECLSATLGKCIGVCCIASELRIARYGSDTERRRIRKQYKKNIGAIEVMLRGERPRLLTALAKDMREASRGQRFEEAARLRDQLAALKNVFLHRPVVENTKRAQDRVHALRELQKILKLRHAPVRVEIYDISNTQGALAVGSMAVFINGFPEKSHYRRFRIRSEERIDDAAMMREVIMRRLRHALPKNQKYAAWPLPDVLIVDGGKGQVGGAIEALRNTKYLLPHMQSMPILGLAKGKNELHFATVTFKEGAIEKSISYELKAISSASRSLQHLLIHLQDEAHRFAITYHRKLRGD